MRRSVASYLLSVLFACFFTIGMQAQVDAIKVDENKVFEFMDLDEKPVFRKDVSDSYDSLRRYVQDQIVYPNEALKYHALGRVYVSYVVLEDGKVDQVKILKGLGYGLDQEAMRVIRLTSGLWTPGKKNGKPVKVRMSLPIKFAM
ncbi:MAG: energy transducer TonB [Bacteroidetes bacterium]|jgi:TonB family protein|nr:energy transducer TonB [Bacteroidota bacterium]